MEEDKTRETDVKIEQGTEDVKELTDGELEDVTGGCGIAVDFESANKLLKQEYKGVAW